MKKSLMVFILLVLIINIGSITLNATNDFTLSNEGTQTTRVTSKYTDEIGRTIETSMSRIYDASYISPKFKVQHKLNFSYHVTIPLDSWFVAYMYNQPVLADNMMFYYANNQANSIIDGTAKVIISYKDNYYRAKIPMDYQGYIGELFDGGSYDKNFSHSISKTYNFNPSKTYSSSTSVKYEYASNDGLVYTVLDQGTHFSLDFHDLFRDLSSQNNGLYNNARVVTGYSSKFCTYGSTCSFAQIIVPEITSIEIVYDANLDESKIDQTVGSDVHSISSIKSFKTVFGFYISTMGLTVTPYAKIGISCELKLDKPFVGCSGPSVGLSIERKNFDSRNIILISEFKYNREFHSSISAGLIRDKTYIEYYNGTELKRNYFSYGTWSTNTPPPSGGGGGGGTIFFEFN